MHCSSASHRMWKPLAEQLSTRYRVLAPNLIGYGDSDTWPADQPFDPSADVEVVLRLAALAAGPAHIAAHSYGAAVALEAARQLDGKGSLRSAAAIYMSFWIGRLRWWLMPNKQRRRIIETVNKVAAEFDALDQMSTPPEAYARISVPTRLVVGGRTRRPARAVVDVLLACAVALCVTQRSRRETCRCPTPFATSRAPNVCREPRRRSRHVLRPGQLIRVSS